MNNQVVSTIIFLAITMLSGCSTLESMRTWIIGIQTSDWDAESLKYEKEFEEGRLAEYSLADGHDQYDNIAFASQKYNELIECSNRYGEYGRARLLRKWYWPEYEEDVVKYLISCAERSSNTSRFYPDSVMDSAFSVAAMFELADIARDEYDKGDIANWLYSEMSRTVMNKDIRGWVCSKKGNSVSKKIYEDIISAVESKHQVSGLVKKYTWNEVRNALIENQICDIPGSVRQKPLPKMSYEVVRFVKVPRAVCQYDFEAQLFGSNTFDAIDKVKSALRRQLVNDFRAAHPSFSVNDVGISFPSWSQSGSTITGSVVAKALKLEVVRREYSKDSGGQGKVICRLGDNDVAAAEKLAIDNIESIASRHNILNVVGDQPPKGARYKVIKSRETDDGLFEIEFKCE